MGVAGSGRRRTSACESGRTRCGRTGACRSGSRPKQAYGTSQRNRRAERACENGQAPSAAARGSVSRPRAALHGSHGDARRRDAAHKRAPRRVRPVTRAAARHRAPPRPLKRARRSRAAPAR
ncbi:ABC transporter substrate-binding protein [Burkholderia pseudomallei]|nr:ABC transporter substrate-binding protein [Burkholderia pseudomallei]